MNTDDSMKKISTSLGPKVEWDGAKETYDDFIDDFQDWMLYVDMTCMIFSLKTFILSFILKGNWREVQKEERKDGEIVCPTMKVHF